jgi:diguanylate cyclase (GGDEF)-like protein
MTMMDKLVREWAAAIHSVCFVPMSRAERAHLLRRFARELTEALRSEPFDPAAGYRVGAALVGADYAVPEVLARTITLLYRHRAGERWDRLVEAVAVGFTRAVRDRTLGAQEGMRLADRVARTAAERELRDSRARVRQAVRYDALTGLPNQTTLLGRLKRLLTSPAEGSRVGVCCLDLDRFEAINDSLGPQVGDRLLVAVADRLRWLAADTGHLIARRNSDQFAIVVADTGCAEDITKLADQTLTVLAEPYRIDGHELTISASAGMVEQPAAGTSPTELLRTADVALHWAKADGRHRWRLFDERRSAQDLLRYRLSARMPAAMLAGEFQLVYQPLVDLETGLPVGAEALARWHHPEYGVLGADRFVGLAEDTGLIVPLGMRLLEQACRVAAGWRGDPPPFVSVNLSARQLHQPGLAGEIAEVLDRTGLPPGRLQLEITETALVSTDQPTIATLHSLAGYGIRIAIDDFGTGYSNVGYLYDLPVHGIKLAGRLLQDGRRRTGRAGDPVLAALVSMGRALDLTVTSEGIEKPAQAKRVRALGCRLGQGWHFGRPVPPDQLQLG